MSIAADATDLPVYTASDLEGIPPFDVPVFGNAEAVELGSLAVALIRERRLDLAVDVRVGEDLVFRAKVGPGTGPGNDQWLAGKAAVARYFGIPSLLVRRRFEEAGTAFAEVDDPLIDHEVMKAHGGCIPIFVRGELVGTITTSGEPDVIDHQTAADALAAYLAR